MSIEDIVKAWKSDELKNNVPENPIGEELSEDELREVVGGLRCTLTCLDASLICDPSKLVSF